MPIPLQPDRAPDGRDEDIAPGDNAVMALADAAGAPPGPHGTARRRRISGRRLARSAIDLAAVVAVVIAIGGWLGPFGWLLDLLNFLRPHALVLSVVVLLLSAAIRDRFRMRAAIGLVAVASLSLLLVRPPTAGLAATGNVVVLTANLMGRGVRYDALASLINAERPDVIIFQEAVDGWGTVFKSVRDHYYGSDLPQTGVVVVSRHPFTMAPVATPRNATPDWRTGGGAAVRARIPLPATGTVLTLYAIHAPTVRRQLGWDVQNRYVSEIGTLAAADAAKGDVMVVGDWNLPYWSPRLSTFLSNAHLATTETGPWPPATRFLRSLGPSRLVGAPIDRIAVSGSIALQELSLAAPIGSDHLPLIGRLQVPPDGTRP